MFRRRWQKVLLATATLVAATLAFAGWYRAHYSMDVARSFEVGDSRASVRVLVATQGSEFKDAVVSEVIRHLRARSAYVKIVDVSALPGIDEREWNAVVLVHTWEMRKPPGTVRAFVDRAGHSGRLVTLTTSGAGTFKLDGIDAISSASVVAEAPSRAAEITAKLDAILDGAPDR